MRIIFDTSAIIESSRTLQSSDFLAIFSSKHQIHLQIIVPQLVIHELANRFREDLARELESLRKALATVNRLVREPLDISMHRDYVAFESAAYQRRIEYELQQVDARTPPYPQESHEEVVARALSRRKPFKESGAGYRDYLIWLSALEELVRNPTSDHIYFVSFNHKDFFHDLGKNRWELHPDLQADLTLFRINPAHFHVFTTIHELREIVINPRLKSMGDLAQRVVAREFLDAQFSAGIRPAVEAWFTKHLKASGFPELDLPPDTYSVSAVEVGDVERYVRAQVREIAHDELVVDLTILIHVRFVAVTQARDSAGQPLLGFDLSIPRVTHTPVEKTVRFIISTIVGAPPEYEVIAMDAILFHKPR